MSSALWWAVALFMAFGLALGGAAWWVWQQREVARRQAETNAELAVLGRGVRALGHDLRQHLDLVAQELHRLGATIPPEVRAQLGIVEEATRGAARLVDAVRGRRSAEGPPVATDGIVRLGVLLLQGGGVPIDLRVDGSLPHGGTEGDVLRVVQNLLSNAFRAASTVPSGWIRVECLPDQLRVTNPVADATSLDDGIYDEGVSHHGSEGLGLSVARAAAERVGWMLRHEIHGHEVTFVLRARGSG